MTFVAAMVVITLVVATVAVWPPTAWQAVLLGAVPVAVGAAVLDVPVIRSGGWLISMLGPYLLMTVLPILPWRRGWARWAVPTSVAMVLLALVLVTRAAAPVLFFLVLPFVTVLLGLRRGLRRSRAITHLGSTPPNQE